ncbi:MAG: diguanylate cyclase [Thermoanaerobaculia bacterium]
MTLGFAFALLAITFGLSMKARGAQERWTRIVNVETESVAAMEELIRSHNAFRRQIAIGDPRAAEKYRSVEQILERPALRNQESAVLRERVQAFSRRVQAIDLRLRRVPGSVVVSELDAASNRVVNEARRLIEWRKQEIARQLPRLERETRSMMIAGMAISWMIVLMAGVAVKIAYQRVVRPMELLSEAADKIGAGQTDVVFPVHGDYEVARLSGALKKMAQQLTERARIDDLTALPNFRAFREHIEEEIQRSIRFEYEVGILVLDLDRFKQYNDRFGHLAGNDALQRVAQAIREAVRRVDFPARYGGEEFAVVAPRIDVSTLELVAERIRSTVEALPAPEGGAQVTISIGAAIYPADGATADALFQVADERLYRAKREGRNRVVVSSPRAAKSAG